MMARFGASASEGKAVIYLADAYTGKTVGTAGASGATLQEAIEKACSALEDKLSIPAWRCNVVGRKDGGLIIDRGRLDGVRKGLKLLGYSISPTAPRDQALAPELLLMQYGTRKGTYEVTVEGEEFSTATPIEGAVLLEAGDVLELPTVVLPARSRETRGKKTFDDIYNRK